MALVALILMIGLANFTIGFALAVHSGHGPGWSELARLVRNDRRNPKGAGSPAKAGSH